MEMKMFFDDSEFDAQFARTVGKSVVGMADVGECFAAASRMTPGDYGSWWDSWHSAAERVEHIAEDAAKAGRRRSAGDAHFWASEYHRASYFFDRVDLGSTSFGFMQLITSLSMMAAGTAPRSRRPSAGGHGVE
jgi:hypothetical protein